MTKMDEQHKANEIVRSNTIETSGLNHEIRVRDILLGIGAEVSYENQNSEKKKETYKAVIDANPNLAIALMAEDAAYQVGLATVKGEHKEKREAENNQRLLASMGYNNNQNPLDILKEQTNLAKKLLKKRGYKVTRK
jgi:hypothetical protein